MRAPSWAPPQRTSLCVADDRSPAPGRHGAVTLCGRRAGRMGAWAVTDSSLDPAIAGAPQARRRRPGPAVAQQHDTGEVLMVGWMDDEALHRTLTTGRCTYWRAAGRSTGSRATPAATSSGSSRSRSTATATPCWCGSTRSAPPATPVTGPASTPTCCRPTPAPSGRRDRRRRRSRTAPTSRASARRSTRSCRSPGGCSPTARPRSASIASSPAGRARSCSSRPSTAGQLVALLVHRRARAATLTERDGQARLARDRRPACRAAATRSRCCGPSRAVLRAPRAAGMPPLMGGLVGYLGYDFVRRIERLPEPGGRRPAACPSCGMMLATDLAVLDHSDGSACWSPNVAMPPTPTRRPRARRTTTRWAGSTR